jgi:Rha family phage regulatory protein
MNNKNLVTIQEAKAVTSSLQVSNTFEKRHADVIRSIEDLISMNAKLRSYFVSDTYVDNIGRKQPMYLMNRDGFALLAMGFTGKRALQFKLDYINAFNEMELYLKNTQSSKEIEDSKNRKSESISAESMQRNIRMMHEQLFANMDNMGMLFSPVFLQVNAFTWDDTRSVRANIREFINNYYKVALGSARLLKEKANRENESEKMIERLEWERSLYKMKYESQYDILKYKQDIVNMLFEELRR